MLVVAKDHVGLFHFAAAFAVNAPRTVNKDVADRRVFEQHFQGAQAERFVKHLADQPFTLIAVQQRVFRFAKVFDNQADFAAQRVAFELTHARQIELVDQLAVDALLQFFVVALFRVGGA